MIKLYTCTQELYAFALLSLWNPICKVSVVQLMWQIWSCSLDIGVLALHVGLCRIDGWHKANNRLLSRNVRRMYLYNIFIMILPIWKVTFVLPSIRGWQYIAKSRFEFIFSSGNLCHRHTQNGLETHLPSSLGVFRVNWPVCEAYNIPPLKGNNLHGVVLVKWQVFIIALVPTGCYQITVVSKYCMQWNFS